MKKRLTTIILATALLATAFLISGCSLLSPPPFEDVSAEETPAAVSVVISELMASNKATLASPSGSFADWLELYNAGTDSVELEDFVLSDGKTDWALPALTLEAGEYRVLFCSEPGGDELTAPFSLSKNGEALSLRYADGTLLDSFEYSSAQADVSLVKDADGVIAAAEYASPGFENSDAGYSDFQASKSSGALVINEVMSYNSWYAAPDYACYDWVELKNVSSQPILLSDYYISDDNDDLVMYRLPEQTLEPNGLFLLQCIDENREDFGGYSAPFAIGSTGDDLYICHIDGTLSDYTPVAGLKYGGSFGRMDGKNGFFYFDIPSPAAENSVGARLISRKPAADTEQGVYEDIQTLSVALNGAGKIYYTLDGSIPTVQSALYEKPLSLSATTLVRCVAVETGKLPSEAASFSYIINEGHELPVVSLAVDPEDMYDQRTGIYTNPTMDWERQASVAFFDGDDGFAIDCGLKLHGATSREAQKKKSYKLKFKDRYEGELNYDLFGNGVTVFSDVLLRAAQESTHSSHLRDILMHELAAECYDGLPTQDYKFAVLYLNGEYWGIYSIREAHSQEHYANHYGYSAESVVMTQGQWDKASPLTDAFSYAHDFAYGGTSNAQADYEYLENLMDIDSLITWQIIQSYSGNLDINPPNVRFYYSTEDNIARYALVDLDLGLFTPGTYGLAFNTGYDYSYFFDYLECNELFRTRMMEKLSEYLSGPLSDENVVNELHSLADEIRSEIPRDALRWDYDVGSWERDLGYIEGRLTVNGGMAKNFAETARTYLDIYYLDWAKYFSAYDD